MPTYINGVSQDTAYAAQSTQLTKARRLLWHPGLADWTSTTANSSYVQATSHGGVYLGTGADDAARTAVHYTGLVGFGGSTNAENRADFTNAFTLQITASRNVSNATAIARLQIKTLTSEGAIGAAVRGVGLEIQNYELYIESCDGSTRSAEDTGYALSDRIEDTITLVFTPGVSIVTYVNGVLKYTKTTNIPTGVTDTAYNMVLSVTKTSGAGDLSVEFTQPQVIYKR